jgi:hypothetical protein
MPYNVDRLTCDLIPEAHREAYKAHAAKLYLGRELQWSGATSLAWITPILSIAGTILATTYFGKAFSYDVSLAGAGGSAIALAGLGMSLVVMGHFERKATHEDRYLEMDLFNAYALHEWQKARNRIDRPGQAPDQAPAPGARTYWSLKDLKWGDATVTYQRREEFKVFSAELYAEYDHASWMKSWCAWALFLGGCGAIIIGVTLFGEALSYDQPIAGAGGTAIGMSALTGTICGACYLQVHSHQEEYFTEMSTFNHAALAKWREKIQKEQRALQPQAGV